MAGSRSSSTKRNAPDGPSLDLGCEPQKQSDPSPKLKPAFVNLRENLSVERVPVKSGSTNFLLLTFDNLQRQYVRVQVESDGLILLVEEGRWPGREHLFDRLRRHGCVPDGWARVYAGHPEVQDHGPDP